MFWKPGNTSDALKTRQAIVHSQLRHLYLTKPHTKLGLAHAFSFVLCRSDSIAIPRLGVQMARAQKSTSELRSNTSTSKVWWLRILRINMLRENTFPIGIKVNKRRLRIPGKSKQRVSACKVYLWHQRLAKIVRLARQCMAVMSYNQELLDSSRCYDQVYAPNFNIWAKIGLSAQPYSTNFGFNGGTRVWPQISNLQALSLPCHL